MKSAESLPAAVPVYDEMLKRDWSWAIDEGDRFFSAGGCGLQELA